MVKYLYQKNFAWFWQEHLGSHCIFLSVTSLHLHRVFGWSVQHQITKGNIQVSQFRCHILAKCFNKTWMPRCIQKNFANQNSETVFKKSFMCLLGKVNQLQVLQSGSHLLKTWFYFRDVKTDCPKLRIYRQTDGKDTDFSNVYSHYITYW